MKCNHRRLALVLLGIAACADYERPPRACETLGLLCVQEDVIHDLGLTDSKGASADLDGDGYRELVSASPGGLSIAWSGSQAREYQLFPGGVPDLALGDIDGDDDIDLVFLTAEPPTLRVLENRGTRTLAEGPTLALTGELHGLWLGELDGDGKLDALVSASENGRISVITGGLKTLKNIVVGRDLAAVEAGDMNGDGKPDIVAIDRADASIHVLLASGSGFTTPQRTATGVRPEYLQLYDHDGDGRLDVLTHGTGREIWFHPGDGSGGLGDARGLVVQAGASPGFMAHRDELGQRWLVTIDDPYPIASRLDDDDRVVARTLTGSIQDAESLDIDGDAALVRSTWLGSRYSLAPSLVFAELWHGGAHSLQPLALADLDQDGETDLVSVDGDVTVRRRLADGTWGEPWTLAMDKYVVTLAVADVTGDGVPDLVIGDSAPSVIVAVGAGDGTFTAGPPAPLLQTPDALSVGFAAADEPASVAVGGYDPLGVVVLRFDAAGAVTDTGQPLPTEPVRALESADIDGDGDADMVAYTMTDELVIVPHVDDGWGPPSTRSLADLRLPDLPDHPLQNPSITVGDIDLDGRVDAVLVASSAVVRLLDITADPPPAPRIDKVEGLSYPDHLALADLDEDGLLDLVTNSTGELQIILFASDGELRPQEPLALSYYASTLHVDPEGRVTAAFSSARGNSILRPELAPALARVSGFDGGPRPLRRLATGDIDADGHTDIVVADEPGIEGSIAVLWGSADGSPRQAILQASTLFASAEIAVAPLDDRPGDDVVVAWSDGFTLLYTYQDGALARHSTGRSPLSWSTDTPGVGLQARGDGRSDVIVLGRVSNDELGVAALARGEDGGLVDQPYELVWRTPSADGQWAMTIADFDGDGYGDIAVLPGLNQPAMLLWGDPERSPELTPVDLKLAGMRHLSTADLDGDGDLELIADGVQATVSVEFTGRAPLASVLLSGQSDALLAADLQNDGRPDLLRVSGNVLGIVARTPAGDDLASLDLDPPWTVLQAAHLDGDDLLDLVGIRDGAVVTRLSADP